MKKLLLFSAFLAFANAAQAQQVYPVMANRVVDFPGMNLEAKLMHQLGDKLLIYAKAGPNDFEMWTYDLATGNAEKIAENFSNYDQLYGSWGFKGYVNLNGNYYTAPPRNIAGTTLDEIEPLITTGNPGGTQVLADLNPNSGANYPSSNPTNFTVFDNHVIFNATTGSPTERLFKHDGINPPSPITGQHRITETAIVNNELIFLGEANNDDGIGKLSSASSTPVSLAEFNNTTSLAALGNKAIFYGEKYGSGFGYELYITDGTAAGTTLLKDLVPGTSSPVKPTRYITTDTAIPLFAVLNGVAYFSFQDGATSKYYLYRTDGTPAGTYSLMESTTLIRDVLRVGDKITCLAWNDALNKRMTYVTTGGTPVPLTDGGSGYYSIEPSNIHGSFNFNGNRKIVSDGVYMLNGTSNYNNLIVSDGTPAGTKAFDISQASGYLSESDIDDLVFVGTDLYFRYTNAVYKLNLSSLVSAEEELATNNQIRVYPNPAKNTVFISANQAVNVEVLTVTGQVAATYKNTQTIDVANLPAGLYALRITDAGGNLLKTERLVKSE